MPIASASCRFEGFRRRSKLPSPRATTGVSASVMPKCLSSWPTSGVGFHVHPGEQRAVLGQEVAHTEGIGGVTGADHPQADEVRRLAQELPPGDERLQDDLTQDRAL